MKILFLTHYYPPHIGGVEKHAHETAKALVKKGYDVSVLTEKYAKKLKVYDFIDDIEVVRFSYPQLKFIGILFIWYSIFKNRYLIRAADIVHIHDVFIWYLPFKFMFPRKKIVTTMHGWEGEYPVPTINIRLKQLARKYSDKVVAVGKYIGKYYSIKADKIIYGATVNAPKEPIKKIKNKVVFVGRLEKDTGLLEFIRRLDDFKNRDVTFVGDGKLKNLCKKYGKVTGFADPSKYLKTAEYAVPAGYLSYIEALAFKCKIIVYPDNQLKIDYWDEIKNIKKFPSWEEIANEYIALYNNI